MNDPILLHIPHSSTLIPKEYEEDYTVDLPNELRFMTDWYTEELFDYPATKLVFPVSRLVCDVERFRDSRLEEMSRRGMGACYTHGYMGSRIRSLSREKEEQILQRWYDPHHRSLKDMTAEKLDHYGTCLIIDCHSFHASPLPYEPDKRDKRPDICIGADPFHTPGQVIELLTRSFAQRGYSVAVNSPYSGAITPLDYYRRNRDVMSVMIEVNRGLYLSNDLRKNDAFSSVKRDIGESIDELKSRS